MNERIEELMKQAGTDTSGKWMGINHAEKFANLIVAKCISIVDNAVKNHEPTNTYVDKIKGHFGL